MLKITETPVRRQQETFVDLPKTKILRCWPLLGFLEDGWVAEMWVENIVHVCWLEIAQNHVSLLKNNILFSALFATKFVCNMDSYRLMYNSHSSKSI